MQSLVNIAMQREAIQTLRPASPPLLDGRPTFRPTKIQQSTKVIDELSIT